MLAMDLGYTLECSPESRGYCIRHQRQPGQLLRKWPSCGDSPIEDCSDRWTQEVKQQRSGNAKANPASQQINSKKIDQITQNLGRDNRYRQSAPPKAAFEPTRAC